MFHFMCTFTRADCKLLLEWSLLLDLLFAFKPHELLYQLVTIADSLHILKDMYNNFEGEVTSNNIMELIVANGCSFLQAIELENKKGTMEYLSLSFDDELHHKLKQMVTGFEEYCPSFDHEQHHKMKQRLMT